MPWKETDAMEERVRFVVRAARGEEALSALCREFGISRKTGYKWLHRYREVGSLRGLAERSRRPRSSPGRTPAVVEVRIEALWRAYGWGSRKLQWRLAREGVQLARSTIDRILDRRGLRATAHARSRTATRRFERSRPNELVQMDFKGEYRLRTGGWCYPLSLLDDHSRFNLGLFALPSQRTQGVQRSLITSFERYGVPESLLLDHGTPWWSPTNGHGLTQLSVWLIRQGIRLHFSAFRHPQTQGKVERFHRTLDETVRHWGRPETLPDFAATFEHFRSIYNHQRPHEALAMQPPARRYRPSPRPYQPEPPAWEYPEGTTVQRLNPAGCLKVAGRRYFVCESLAGEEVAWEGFDGKLLVTYRHMHVREIDLDSGRTRPLAEAVARPSSTSYGG